MKLFDNLPRKFKVLWREIIGKPDTFPPSYHTHSEYAASNHSHSNYAASNHTHNEYAASNHSHTGYAASSHTHNYAGSASSGGAANSALKLSTARTIQTNLASTAAVSFDGSGNASPGVTGILSIDHGGTGNRFGRIQAGAKAGTEPLSTSTAEGRDTTSTHYGSHAEGIGTIASAQASHAEGEDTTASGSYSKAGGVGTIASSQAQTAIGKYNVQYGTTPNDANSYFIIGNGTSIARSNAFRVHSDGSVYGKKSYNTGGADYAEYFEWLDGNPDNEDRRGYFVTIDGEKIKLASPQDDYILGVISGKPSVIGNSDPDGWHAAFTTDDFGEFITIKTKEKRTIYHTEEVKETYTDENGEEAVRTVPQEVPEETWEEVDSYVMSQDYDASKPYTPRSERQEWAAVGMLGVLRVRDDGTCQVNSYCTVSDGGIATASDHGYRVIARVTDNIVKIVFR